MYRLCGCAVLERNASFFVYLRGCVFLLKRNKCSMVSSAKQYLHHQISSSFRFQHASGRHAAAKEIRRFMYDHRTEVATFTRSTFAGSFWKKGAACEIMNQSAFSNLGYSLHALTSQVQETLAPKHNIYSFVEDACS